MDEKYTLESLRQAIGKRHIDKEAEKQARFEKVAHRYEQAVHALMEGIRAVVEQIPDFEVSREDETEVFTSPAFQGHEMEIQQKRLRITLGDDFILFDPTARAIVSAHGQVEIVASRPISYMIEKVLYLVDDPSRPEGAYWGYRSVEDMSGHPVRFTKESLIKLLHQVFS